MLNMDWIKFIGDQERYLETEQDKCLQVYNIISELERRTSCLGQGEGSKLRESPPPSA